MIETRKMMQRKDDGTEEQYYPETHVASILGLSKLLKNYDGKEGTLISSVTSVNGKNGAVFITQKDIGLVVATETTNGLLSKELFKEIQLLIENKDDTNLMNEFSIENVKDSIFQMFHKGIPFYPKTIVDGIDGLEELLIETGIKGEKGDPGEPGPPGSAENLELATTDKDGLMSSSDKQQLAKLAQYTFVKIGEI